MYIILDVRNPAHDEEKNCYMSREGYLMLKTGVVSDTFNSKTGVIYSWCSPSGKAHRANPSGAEDRKFHTFYSQIILPSTHFPETALHATYRSYFM